MRKVVRITLSNDDRDKGKVFVITEMSAMRAEEWAMRAFIALSRGGVEVPEDVVKDGLAGLASIGLQGLQSLSYADVKPLLDEMLDCVAVSHDRKNPDVTRSLIEDDVEEIATLLRLRAEVYKLHVNFSQAGGPLSFRSPMTRDATGSENMSTSPAQSAS